MFPRLLMALSTLLLSGLVWSAPADVSGAEPGDGAVERSVVVVDTGVEDWQTLARGVHPNARVVYIAPDDDGLSALAEALRGQTGLQSIEIISHGSAGRLRLGSSSIDRAALEARAGEWRRIGASLAPGGDILLGACALAAGPEGRQWLDRLARVTGADVAASIDETGAENRGANWTLESKHGEIQSASAVSAAARAAFRGRLAISSQAVFDFEGYGGSLVNGTPFSQTITASNTADEMSFSDWRIDKYDSSDIGVNLNDSGLDSIFSDPAGDSFQFVSFTTAVFCGSPMTFDVVGYEDGAPVAGASKSFSLDGTAGVITRPVGFASVDEVRFENYSAANTAQCMTVDDIVVDQAVASNTQPSFVNLDATVTYDEAVGAPTVIDGNAEITDAELDGANDYAGSALTVARTVGANANDEFGFDTGSGTFSVSGSDLVTGGNVFASFTESGGALTINFNSSQAAATSALVDDVLQGITYAHAGNPDIVEYTLSLAFDDGGGLSVGDSRPVVVDPDLAPIASTTTLDFTAQESEFSHGDRVDARIIEELLFYGFEFEHVNNSFIDSSDLHVADATADKNTTPNRIESDSPFQLDSIDIENFSSNAQDVTVYGYLNGSEQASETFSFAGNEGPLTFDIDTLNGAFKSVDELRFTTSVSDGVAIDNIVVDAGNQSPSLDLDNSAGGNDHATVFSENTDQGTANTDGTAVTGTVASSDADGTIETVTLTLDNAQGDTGEGLSIDTAPLAASLGFSPSATQITISRNSATNAELVEAIEAVRYQNNSDTPDSTARTVTLEVTDNGGATASATASISIEPGNDAPSVTAPGGILQPDEDVAFDLSGANEIQIADVDAGGGTVEVSLSANSGTLTLGSTSGVSFDSGSNGNGAFTVAGTVTDLNNALATLDYLGNADYFGADTVSATVNDRGNTGVDPGNTGDGSSEADSTSVALDVQPVPDAPTISAIADQSTDEDTTLSGIAFTVDDAETAAGSLTLSLSSDTPSLIAGHAFGGSGANRTLEVTPAAEANGSAVITVEVSDGSLTTSEDFLFTVDAVNDLPTVTPAISTLDTTVDEDAAVPSINLTVDDVEDGGAGVTVTASSDNQTLVPDANLSVTDNGGGNRTLGVTLASDENGSANITVTLNDGTDTVDDSFTLTVNPQNDAPTVSLDQNSGTIAENNGGSVTVAQITIDDDGEAGSNNNLSLTGPDAGDFAINGSDLDFTGSADFETKSTYDVTVEVDDPNVGGTPDDVAGFTLNISDVDETPTFSASGPFSVSESAGNGTAVGDVDAVDGDGGAADANLTYSIVGGNTGGAFAIDGGTGAITVADASAVDYDVNASFTLDVEADDGTNAPTTAVSISVINEVPSAPVDSDGASGGSVAEDAANGTAVGITADASDPGGGNVSYALTDDAGGRFQINAGTGIVTVADSSLIDFESANSHSISVRASDNDGADSASVSFTIAVTDVDSAPVFSATGPYSISEAAGDGEAVGDVDANDGENGAADAGISYAITAGNGGGAFAIDNSGVISVADASLVDYESSSAFSLMVEADDGALTASATVTVNVDDMPPSQPVDANGVADSVDEGAANGTAVGVVAEATDPSGGAVTYVLINDAGGRFAIDSGTGEVTVADGGLIDFESQTSHTIEIEARDADGTGSDSLTVNIAVTGVDEAPDLVTPPDLTGADAIDATGLYTAVNLESAGAASATDPEDGALTPSPVGLNNPAQLRAGTHTIEWSVTDSGNATVTANQTVEVRPRASIGPDRTVQEGTTIEVPIALNGDPVGGTTPVIDFGVAGTGSATPVDYAGLGAPGSVTMLGGSRTAVIGFDVLNDGVSGEAPETLVLELTGTGGDTVLAERTSMTTTIVESNTPPSVSLRAEQSGVDPAVVVDGSVSDTVTVTAQTLDATATGNMSFVWNDGETIPTDLANDADPATFEFDPSMLSAGDYEIRVAVTDQGTPQETGNASLRLKVVNGLTALGTVDTDGDGVDDATEGRADQDLDGIPDYRDPHFDRFAIHQRMSDTAGYLVETAPGLNLTRGPVAFAEDTDGARVSAEQIDTVLGHTDEWDNAGGHFDFEVHHLPGPGQSADVVIPQRTAVPEEAVYRVAGVSSGWRTLSEDADNALASAPGQQGFCPPPDDPAYTAGLNAGDWCVRLTLRDGGANDGDAQSDGRVHHLGGVAVESGNTGVPPESGEDETEAEGVTASNSGNAAIAWPGLLLLLAVLMVRRAHRTTREVRNP